MYLRASVASRSHALSPCHLLTVRRDTADFYVHEDDAEYLRDLVAREVLKPQHVPSSDQVAGVFTKALPRLVFQALRAQLVSAVAA